MKRHNYRWKFAISFLVKPILPIFIVLDVISMILIIVFPDESNPFLVVLWLNLALIIFTIITYFVFAITGSVLYNKHSFSQDEDNFYQNKRVLRKDNLLSVNMGQVFKIYLVILRPIKNGLIKSCLLNYYFDNKEEMIYFIMENHLTQYLSIIEKNYIHYVMSMEASQLEKEGWPKVERYACPCCGNLTLFVELSGNHCLCPVCFWEEDQVQLLDPKYDDGANKVSLNQARLNYQEFGACEKEMINYVRKPNEFELPQELKEK